MKDAPDEEEDEVVKEIDVYISQNLASNLNIFQYPLRQPWRKYPMSRLTEIKQRPGQQKVEMSFSLDPNNEFYDAETSINRPPNTTLASSVVQLKTNYAIGIFRKDEIHLTPLQNIYQFRPSFAYLDAADEVQKALQKKDEKEEDESAPMDVDDEFKTAAPRPVQMQYRFKESARGPQRATLADLRKKEEAIPWQIFKFHDFDTDETVQELEKLFDTTREPIVANVPAKAYLPRLCPMPIDTIPTAQTRVDTSQGITMDILKKLPLERQLSEIFGIAQVIHFGKLRELATNAKSELDILPLIEKCAVMVNGRWVARSNLCCSGPRIIARDYILLLFTQQELVSRQQVQDGTGISSDVARDMLAKLAVVVPEKRGWKLKVEPDNDFLDVHPDYVEKFEVYWAQNKADILSKVKDLKEGKYKVQGDAFGSAAALPKTIFRGSEEALEQLKKFIRNIFDKYGVCNDTLIKATWNAAVKGKEEDNKLAEVDDATFNSTLGDYTIKIHGVYALKTVNNHAIDKIRDVVIAEFSQRISMKQSDIKDKVKAALKQDVKASDLSTVLKQLAYLSKNNTQWILKDGTGNQVT